MAAMVSCGPEGLTPAGIEKETGKLLLPDAILKFFVDGR